MANPCLNPHPAARERARQQAEEEARTSPTDDASPRNGSGAEQPVPVPDAD